MEAYFDNSATTRCYKEVADIVVKTMPEMAIWVTAAPA
jgi:cysteine desulfurase